MAGGRKTQSIIDACSDSSKRRLLVTYSTTGQKELRERLNTTYGTNAPEVTGWYSFLINHFVRPYLKAEYPNRTVEGFNFHYQHSLYAPAEQRHFDPDGNLTRVGLSNLAWVLAKKTQEAPFDRLSRIYDEIYFDEVQDLTGWDLEILAKLFASSLHIVLVGDVRQSVYDTNHQDRKNSKYRGLAMIDWFRMQERVKKLQIHESLENWRCRPEIAKLANQVFADKNEISPAVSRQTAECSHQGIFRISPSDIANYVQSFQPLCLRWNKDSGAGLHDTQSFQNMGEVKGLTVDHVLILPTEKMIKFLSTGVSDLKERTACKLYVSITRARFSVAFILDDKVKADQLRRWPTS